MSNYLEFKEIVDTMEAQNYDWRKEIRDIEQAQEKRKNKTEIFFSGACEDNGLRHVIQ